MEIEYSQSPQLSNSNHNMDIIGREQEYEELKLSLKQFCVLEHFGCLMIHGEPGVGKTSLINKLLKDEEFLNDINVEYTLNLNMMKLQTQPVITKAIANQLGISGQSFKKIIDWINSLTKRHRILIILDEIDVLYTKSLSQMNQWITNALNGMDYCQNCIVIGMSNETTGTYELRRLFESSPYFNHLRYSHLPVNDIQRIIETIDTNNLFGKEEKQFILDKVIQKQGDIREAFSLIEKAYKLAEQKNLTKIKMIQLIEIHRSNSPEETFKTYLGGLNDEQLALAIALHISPENNGYVNLDKWYDVFCKCRMIVDKKKMNVKKSDFYTAIEHFVSQGLIQAVVPIDKRGKRKLNLSVNYINGNIKNVVKKYNLIAMEQFMRSNKHAVQVFERIKEVLTPGSIQGMLNSKRNVISYV